jgi:hypothetical protein
MITEFWLNTLHFACLYVALVNTPRIIGVDVVGIDRASDPQHKVNRVIWAVSITLFLAKYI